MVKLIKDRKIRLALVGYGHIAQKHIAAIKQNSEALELIAICESHPESLEKAMTEQGVDGYNDYQALLANADCDAVVLCSPSGLHAAQTLQAAKLGKHIVTEKPMATKWQDALSMVKSCDKAGVHLFVVKQNRYNPMMQLLKKTIDQGRFGKLYHVSANMYWTRPQSYYDKSKWRGTWTLDGGALMNQASHYVDMLHWLIGPVQRVQAMAATLGRNIEVEDTCMLHILWRSGVLGALNVSMLAYPKNFEGSLTLLGEKGTVRLGGVAMNRVDHWEFGESHPDDEYVLNLSKDTNLAGENGHTRYYAENVIKVFRGESEIAIDGQEGLHSLEIITAAYRSARDNQTISLPLEL